jgi:hypothetical protein
MLIPEYIINIHNSLAVNRDFVHRAEIIACFPNVNAQVNNYEYLKILAGTQKTLLKVCVNEPTSIRQ